jgi:hypothetical protein
LLLLLLLLLLQALALDEEVPDIADLEDDTEPDVLGISKHRTTLVRARGLGTLGPWNLGTLESPFFDVSG